MIFGSLVHCLILEPAAFALRYSVAPECDRRTKEGKAMYADFLDTIEGKDIVSHKDFQDAVAMAAAVCDNPVYKSLCASDDDVEQAFTTEYGDYQFKGVKDRRNARAILDIKTCQDASPDAFARQIFRDMYHMQAALYMWEEPSMDFFFVAVDRDCSVSVHRMTPEAIMTGYDALDQLIGSFESCLLDDRWNEGYEFYAGESGWFDVACPKWLIN